MSDGYHKNNPVIREVFPKIYYLDSQRDLNGIQDSLLSFMEDDLLNQMRADCCLFDRSKKCNHCFSCIGLINQKMPSQLNAFETEKLLEGLKEEERQILLRYYAEEDDVDVLAKEYGVSSSTIYSKVSRAKKKVRKNHGRLEEHV